MRSPPAAPHIRCSRHQAGLGSQADCDDTDGAGAVMMQIMCVQLQEPVLH